MKKVTAFFSAVIMGFILFGCSGGGGSSGGNGGNGGGATYWISGTVATSAGVGIPDVTMTFSGTSAMTTTSDSSGGYAVSGVANGTYTVTPSKTGYVFSPSSTTLTINNAGQTTDFTATLGGSGNLVSITVRPANSTIAIAVTQQFTATGTNSDATSQDITSSVTWSSSNTGVATINASGLATGVSAGTTTITA